MRNKNLLGTLQLLLAAFIWGSAFVAQSEGMNFVGPLTFLSVRFILGGVVLLPLIYVKRKAAKEHADLRPPKGESLRYTLVGGVICGLLLTLASGLQQYGLLYTSVGKAGFITTLYVVFVPLCGLFFKKLPGVNLWLAVLLATCGLYLLCMTEGFSLSPGDALVFGSAVMYTAQILAVDHFVKRIDPIALSCTQFLTVGAVSTIPALIIERPSAGSILAAWLPILYAGLLSSGVAFTLQVVAQRYTEPTLASITMSFESVFAVLSGWVILGETLSPREGFGCVVMFAAIILAQLPAQLFSFKKKRIV